MELRKLAKDGQSPTGDCPAVYIAVDRPDIMVVQGKFLEDGTLSQLHDPLSDETAVRIPAETMVRAVELYLSEHGSLA